MSDKVFWPLRLRDVHLVHALHSLAASLLATRGADLHLVLDDSRWADKALVPPAVERFREAVDHWMEPFELVGDVVVQSIHDVIDIPTEHDGAADIWETAHTYLRHSGTSFWNVGRGSKIAPDFASNEETILAFKRENAWRLTDPPRDLDRTDENHPERV